MNLYKPCRGRWNLNLQSEIDSGDLAIVTILGLGIQDSSLHRLHTQLTMLSHGGDYRIFAVLGKTPYLWRNEVQRSEMLDLVASRLLAYHHGRSGHTPGVPKEAMHSEKWIVGAYARVGEI